VIHHRSVFAWECGDSSALLFLTVAMLPNAIEKTKAVMNHRTPK
jgi:hypothetical protein